MRISEHTGFPFDGNGKYFREIFKEWFLLMCVCMCVNTCTLRPDFLCCCVHRLSVKELSA